MKCAVVGVGYLGRFHAQKYSALPQAELIGVCDLNEGQAKKVADELSVPYFTDPSTLIGQVQAVTIASTTRSHFELAKLFLENGVHVNVEKPMTATVEEGQKLVDIAKTKNLKLQVGHIERFNPALIAAQEKLKTPLFIECHRLAPFNPRGNDVSVVLDLMIHDLDVILSLVQSEPVAVSAVGTKVLTQSPDIANARVEFASGAVANITASRVSTEPQRKFRVFQDSQYLSIDFGNGQVRLMTKTGEMQENHLPIEKEEWNLEKGDALKVETEAFINSILNDQPCLVTGEDGLAALKLADLINQKIDERRI
ncbi:MAG: Gfo/Idh/MocA family oxidoreductase [Bdellovibrionales bacterium]|nr:Gfo/Idh/MocA family oxidoreductase [Bdellovibrionales bacterium]